MAVTWDQSNPPSSSVGGGDGRERNPDDKDDPDPWKAGPYVFPASVRGIGQVQS
jgi:hypothetical protein